MSSEVPPEAAAEEALPPLIEVSGTALSSSLMIYVVGFVALSVLGGAAYYFLVSKNRKGKKEIDVDEAMAANSVGLGDISYIASKLHPQSTHMDVLWTVISTPENIAYGLKAEKAKEKLREERIKSDKEEVKANMFDFDDEGWADDDDDDMDEEAKHKAKLEKEAEEQKKRDREQLEKATGKAKILMEGIDDGVIGQKWVENTLAENGFWPPKDLGILEGAKFNYNGKKVSALEHPGLRRNMCMLMGRLNSMLLNTHPELLEAGSKRLVDQTYFKGSMEFRGRCSMLLEAVLRTALTLRNAALARTIVETVGMFKIGCTSRDKVEWFNEMMKKQYQCLPRVEIANATLERPDEMEAGDVLSLCFSLNRSYAEAFTRQKIAMFQKQGIPPQVGLQTYRECWWLLVQAERLDGEMPASDFEIITDGMLREVDKKDIKKFEKTACQERLLTAYPVIVQNCAQKSGKVKLQFSAPSVPGKYKFTVSVKSQEFLGADQEFSIEETIEEVKEGKGGEHEETKKDK